MVITKVHTNNISCPDWGNCLLAGLAASTSPPRIYSPHHSWGDPFTSQTLSRHSSAQNLLRASRLTQTKGQSFHKGQKGPTQFVPHFSGLNFSFPFLSLIPLHPGWPPCVFWNIPGTASHQGFFTCHSFYVELLLSASPSSGICSNVTFSVRPSLATLFKIRTVIPAARYSLHPFPALVYSLALRAITKYSLFNFKVRLDSFDISSEKAQIYKVFFHC